MASENVAKVVLLKGQVRVKLPNGNVVPLKESSSLDEGAVIQTAEKSFVKLMFIDKSVMNLGPNSQMIINAFPKKEAGIITLVKGQIRSKVTKDYMDMDDKAKSKLYIKTKTAAMGIRGTDFQVNYNPVNQNTALITFEGRVAMSNIEREVDNDNFNQNKLEQTISSEKAVLVSKGEVSAINLNVSEKAMIPTKLGTKQIEALELNETGITSELETKKQFRNPIPPGAEGSQFSNTPVILANEQAKLGTDLKTNLPNSYTNEVAHSPDGYFNMTTGDYKLPSGSVIDLSTVNIVPPPANAFFDKNSGTYIVPESLGKINHETGEYIAPAGLELTPEGKFNIVNPESFIKSQQIPESEILEPTTTSTTPGSNRAPASINGEATTGTVAATTKIAAPEMFSGAAVNFMNTFAKPVYTTNTPQALDPNQKLALGNLAKNILNKNDLDKQAATNTAPVNNTTKVKIILDQQ